MKAVSRMLLMIMAVLLCLSYAAPAVAAPVVVAPAVAAPVVTSPVYAAGVSETGEGESRYLVRLKDGVPTPFSLLRHAEGGPAPVVFAQGFYTVRRLEDIQKWLDAGLVEYVGPDAELELLDTLLGGDPPADGPLTNDPLVVEQWYLDLLEAVGAWEAGLSGEGVTVAVIDSGICREHEDLDYGLIQGYSFLGLPENFASYDDRTGHGTFVTGILAAQGNNEKGLAGLTDKANILSLRCFSSSGTGDHHSGSGMVSTVLSAIGYAMEQNVDIINMSFGGTNEAALLPLAEKLQEAAAQGIILVAAAGNSGGSTLYYPVAFDFVVGVGMVDESGNVDPKSQRNSSVFVTAPGSGVPGLGYTATRPYVTGTGTSYAASMVSAMAVIAKQMDSCIDNEGFQRLLCACAEDRGDVGYDTSYGHGLINAGLLVKALSRPYAINYECGDGSLDGEEGTDYPVSYTIDRLSAVTLPVPIRDGYTFGGWYDDPDYAGKALTIVPPGSVGDLTYYARWIEQVDATLAGVTVLGISAVLDSSDLEGKTYLAELPAGTVLSDISAEDIKAFPANGEDTVVTLVPGSEGAVWTVSFSDGAGGTVECTIRVVESENAAPAVADSKELQSGFAAPASYDGKTEAVSYGVLMSDWFTDDGPALTYFVSSTNGSGKAEITGANLTYTPAAADAGTEVRLKLRAHDGQFDSIQDVSVCIGVAPLPVSDSSIEPVAVLFDKACPPAEDLAVILKLFGNTLLSLRNGDTVLEEGTDYVLSGLPVIDGGDGVLNLSSDYLVSLADGLYDISFSFSGGREKESETVILALTVADSTPEYTVLFLNGDTEYYRIEGVRQGDTVTLPDAPAKSGFTFGGWYTALDGGGTQVTGSTPITLDLGSVDGIVTLYARWTATGGSGGDSGGGSGGGGEVAADQSVR